MARRELLIANNPLLAGPKFQERQSVGIPYRELRVSAIDRDSKQPRTSFDQDKLGELAQSIKRYGVLSPILVRASETPGRYNLISGERRLRASQLLGLDTIPALISSERDTSEETTLAIQLVENIQRADLSSLERAQAIGALKESHGMSVRQVAEALGVSKSMVQRSLDILELPDDLLNALREGASESKVLLLAKIEDQEIRASYLQDLGVLTRNQLKKDLEKEQKNKKAEGALSAEDERIAEEIQRSIGLKVKLVRSQTNVESGKLSIEFYSDQDLQEIFRKLVA